MKNLHEEFSEKKCKELECKVKMAQSSLIDLANDWVEIWVPNFANRRGSTLYYSAKLDTLRYPTLDEFYGRSN